MLLRYCTPYPHNHSAEAVIRSRHMMLGIVASGGADRSANRQTAARTVLLGLWAAERQASEKSQSPVHAVGVVSSHGRSMCRAPPLAYLPVFSIGAAVAGVAGFVTPGLINLGHGVIRRSSGVAERVRMSSSKQFSGGFGGKGWRDFSRWEACRFSIKAWVGGCSGCADDVICQGCDLCGVVGNLACVWHRRQHLLVPCPCLAHYPPSWSRVCPNIAVMLAA